MNKSELTSGMLVVLRDGKKALIFVSSSISFRSSLSFEIGTWTSLNNYTDDLQHNKNSSMDIVKIYGFVPYDLWRTTPKERLLWERKEKEMTISEIEKQLGYTIKIIGEECP